MLAILGFLLINFAFGKENGVSVINVFKEDTLSSIINFQNQFLNKDCE